MRPAITPSPGTFLYVLGLVVIATHPGRFWLGMSLAGVPILVDSVGALIGGSR